MVDIDLVRLQSTACAMLDLRDGASVDLRLHDARVLALRVAPTESDGVFRNLAVLIDSLLSNPLLLHQLGVDEMFYRTMVLMLRPDLFQGPEPAGQNPIQRRELDPVCDYIRSNLGERLMLTDLEKVSGSSARNLQYAFQQRFGCTPMQWIREERLLMARRALQDLCASDSISEVAIMHGFMNPGVFSAYYKRRFGELPSATVGNASMR
jgi:AraC-like DNA-binding protein